MSLPVPIAAKLGRLIPRLASDHDGEVVATARAIQRTLAAERLDLHDLARTLAARHPTERQRRWKPWGRMRSEEKVCALDAIGSLRLSEWEKEFFGSVRETVLGNPFARLSSKQEGVLDRLLARASGGAQP